MIRVSVRSASPFARAGLESALAADPRFEIVGEHNALFESEDEPDVILIDGSESDLPRTRSTSARAALSPRYVLRRSSASRKTPRNFTSARSWANSALLPEPKPSAAAIASA